MPKTPDQIADAELRALRAAVDIAEAARKALHELRWSVSSELLFDTRGLPYFVVTIPAGINPKIPHGQMQRRTFHLDGSMEVKKL